VYLGSDREVGSAGLVDGVLDVVLHVGAGLQAAHDEYTLAQ
jgi:hypothetical protein